MAHLLSCQMAPLESRHIPSQSASSLWLYAENGWPFCQGEIIVSRKASEDVKKSIQNGCDGAQPSKSLVNRLSSHLGAPLCRGRAFFHTFSVKRGDKAPGLRCVPIVKGHRFRTRYGGRIRCRTWFIFSDHPTSACLDFKKQVRMEADKQPRMDTNGRGCESGKIADCPEISVLIRVHPWFKLFSWFAASGRVLNGWHLGSEMVPRILDRARFGHPVQLVILSRILVRVGPRRGDRSSDRNFPDEPGFHPP